MRYNSNAIKGQQGKERFDNMVKRKLALSAAIAMTFVFVLVAFAACGQPAESSKSEEKLEANEKTTEEVSLSTDPFYVLLIGNDTRKGTAGINEKAYADGNARSDTMMLVRVDPKTYQLTFVTVPRDTKDYADGKPQKLNERYNTGGAKLVVEGVEALTGVDIRYYVDTTFVGFRDIVDSLGGVDVYVPRELDMTEIISGGSLVVPAGDQHLDGAQALILARNRHEYEDLGDIDAYRQSNDRAIAIALLQKVLSNASTAASTTEALGKFVDTNWSTDEAAAYAKDFAEHAGQVTYISGTGPYKGGIDAETELWLVYPDAEGWAAVMKTVDAGGDPNEVLPAPTLQK